MSGKGRGVTGGLTAICVMAFVVLGIALTWGANRSHAAEDAAAIYSSEGGAVAPMASGGATSEDKRPPTPM
jgi:hypothetical protein